MKAIHEKHFNQFPVFDEAGYAGLISNNGIASWLAALSEQGRSAGLDLTGVRISEILPFEENGDTVIRLSKDTSLFETLHHFTGSKVRLVLVCQSKDLSIQRPADIAGIITKSDLGQMVKDLR